MHRVLCGVSIVSLSFVLAGRPGMAVAAPDGGRPGSDPGAELRLAHSASTAAIKQDADQAILFAEDLRLLQALNPLKLTITQIDQILPVLDGIQAGWSELDDERTRALAARKEALSQARHQALRGSAPSSRLVEQLALFQDGVTKKQEGRRRDDVMAISVKLTRILSQAQAQQIRSTTAAALTGRPSPLAMVRITGDGVSATPFQFDDNVTQTPEQQWIDEMEKLRKASGPQVDIRRAKFIDKFLKGMDPNTPEYKQQLDALTRMADEVHSMAADRFEAEQTAMAQNFAQMRAVSKARSKAKKAVEGFQEVAMPNATGLEFFVDQVLLSDRAPAVLREMRIRPTSG